MEKPKLDTESANLLMANIISWVLAVGFFFFFFVICYVSIDDWFTFLFVLCLILLYNLTNKVMDILDSHLVVVIV